MPLLRKRRADVQRLEAFSPGWEVPGRFNFTRDVVDALADDPTRSALTFVDAEGIVDRRSFAEMSGDAARWAHMLRTRLDRGDRVLVILGKSPSWHCAMLGALKGGLVAVPCPDMLRARDIAFRVRHSGARLVIAERSCETEVEEMRNQVDGTVAVLYLDEARSELSRYMPVAPTEDTTAGETALILYTSGTTKDPKGVVHTHAYTWAQRMQASHWLDAHERDVVWCTAGTGWAKAIWNVLLGPWSHGAEVVLHEGPFDPEERLALLEKLGVTVLCQAPTEYRMLAKLDGLAAAYLPRLRHAVSAGEPLNPEVIERFQNALGLTIYDGYGQTENSLLVANNPETPVRPGSMGLPTPGHDVAVIDDDGHVCAAGEEGDLALIGRPPTLFTGYWEAPDDTDAAFRDGWYVTGDRAVRDEEGYLWFVGRADDVILSAAYRIGPFEVESALLEHPAVAESAVVGVPDADRGQLVKAFVVLRQGYEPGDELAVELQEHVKAVTAPYKYPRAISFVDELPKTSSGKIRRVELRAEPRHRVARHPGRARVALARPRPGRGQRRPRRPRARPRLARRPRRRAGGSRPSSPLAARPKRSRRSVPASLPRRPRNSCATRRRRRPGATPRRPPWRSPRRRRPPVAKPRRHAPGPRPRRRRAAKPRKPRPAPQPKRPRAAKPKKPRPAPQPKRPRAAKPKKPRPAPQPKRPRAAKPKKPRPAPQPKRPRAAKPKKPRPAPQPKRPRAAKPKKPRPAPQPKRPRRREAEEAQARAAAEETARREAEAQELARQAEEAERREAEAAAAAAALELERGTVDDVPIEAAEPETAAERASWRDARRARREEAARAKQEAEDAKRRAKEDEEQRRRDELAAKQRAKDEAEQRKRDEASAREDARRRAEEEKVSAKQRAKDEAEQRKRDEADAKQRAKDEAEQRKRDEVAARQRAKDEAEQRKRDEAAAKQANQEAARRRELDAKEAAKQRAEAERAEARRQEEEERRRKKAQTKAHRGLFHQSDDPGPLDDEPEEAIPDLVERLRRYSNIPEQQPVSEDEPAEH